MAANRSKKLIKENHMQTLEAEKKKYRTMAADLLINMIPPLFYGFSLSAYAFLDNSMSFSIILALYSSCTTLAFESAEWINMSRRKFIKPIEAILYTPGFPLWLITPFLVVILLLYLFIKFMTKIDIGKYSMIPNVISAFALLLFFILYIARTIIKMRQDYKKRVSQLK